jgi:hypothetical protein
MESNQKIINQVYLLLKFTFGVVPIVAGLDKFTDLLTQWEQYLNPSLSHILPFAPHTFMMIVGVIEMTAGILVLVKPGIGGYVVSAWLVLISLTLLAGGQYLDVAVRDLVMAVSAFSLARLSSTVSTFSSVRTELRTATIAGNVAQKPLGKG